MSVWVLKKKSLLSEWPEKKNDMSLKIIEAYFLYPMQTTVAIESFCNLIYSLKLPKRIVVFFNGFLSHWNQKATAHSNIRKRGMVLINQDQNVRLIMMAPNRVYIFSVLKKIT